ncbi:hypothetical protein I601_1407 [Nocardioides dokdonensis FR1436]|uniref:Uncharacterized protein n=1 Tax=Nocardioides dokdonensis FR1436 TaxID=1300347 RepID=A0A1A9GK60_9ACTN|nr:hypothetical protein [Nocardioides dokdonensis]ANH37845.1 hypothetical protein I601_1407 [Nocardioides dokdonensis FR1436]
MPETQLPTPHDYRFAQTFTVRLVGISVVALALVLFVGTAVVALAGVNADVLVVVLALGLVGVFALGWWLRNRAYVLRAEEDGYVVGPVRGAGVKRARWADVTEATTAAPHGIDCLVLHLGDAGTTTVPVDTLAMDREQFVREMQRRLRAGQGHRPLG